MTASVAEQAARANRAGLCVVAVRADGSKRPVGNRWEHWQRERPTTTQLRTWFLHEHHTGLGFVCGVVSGNLELLEFDDRGTYDAYKSTATALGFGDLVERIEGGYLEETPGGGFHWPYYCATVDGNTTLAQRPKPPERRQHPHDTTELLIETRGAGGFFVAAPSNGRVHPTGGSYVLRRGDVTTIATITPEERYELWNLARTFDEMPSRDPPYVTDERPAADDRRPGDDFNQRADWGELLRGWGWEPVYQRGEVTYWRRPGKDRGWSATTNYAGNDLFHVFTSSTVFEQNRSYRKFTAYAVMEHGGDFKAAASALRARGYGQRESEPVTGHDAAGAGQAEGGDDDPALGPRLVITPLSAVQARPIDWLWSRWLARGKVHIIGGHAGDGKSTVTAALAAAFSNGGMLPDGTLAPLARTLFLLAEDGLADTLRPRLDQHGADVANVLALEAVAEQDGKRRFFSIDRHLDLLRAAVADHDISSVVIDPITSFMPKADRNAEGDVRDILTPISQFADDMDVAVLAVMHVGKPTGTNRRPLQQLLGATAFGAVARVVWMVAELPAESQDNDDATVPTRRLFGVVKSNIDVKPPPLEWSRPLDGAIVWHGESAHDLSDVLSGAKAVPIEEAKAFLLEELKGGMKTMTGLKQAAKSKGITGATLRRAKEALGVESLKEPAVRNGPWMWKLPNSAPSGGGEDAHA